MVNVRPKVTVISAGSIGDDVARLLTSGDHTDVAHTPLDLPGSHVVVTAEPGEGEARAIADRAPASVVIVAGGPDTCQAVLDATLFPAPRVVGVDGEAGDVAAAAAAVALDRRSEHDCLVAGENGFEPVRACLGARGVRDVV